MIYHVHPVNDIEPHDLTGSQCKCEPKILEEYGHMIVVHNSFDGREAVELAKEILNGNNRSNDIH